MFLCLTQPPPFFLHINFSVAFVNIFYIFLRFCEVRSLLMVHNTFSDEFFNDSLEGMRTELIDWDYMDLSIFP